MLSNTTTGVKHYLRSNPQNQPWNGGWLLPLNKKILREVGREDGATAFITPEDRNRRADLLAELAALRERAKRACAESKTLRQETRRHLDLARFSLAAAAIRKKQVADGKSRHPCGWGMHAPEYYRDQAQHARRLSSMVHQPDVRDMLRHTAQDFDEIAEDLETGAVEVRHPELLPQRD